MPANHPTWSRAATRSQSRGTDAAAPDAAADAEVAGLACSRENPLGACPEGRVCRFGGACVVPPPSAVAAPRTPDDLITRAGDTIADGYGAFAAKPNLDWASVVDAAADAYAAEEDPWGRAWIAAELGAALGDGHSGLNSDALCEAFRGFDAGISNVGACVTEIDGAFVVSRRTSAAPDGLAVGDVIRGFDGRDAATALSDLGAQPRCAPSASSAAMARQRLVDSLLFRAPTDSSLEVEKPDGTLVTLGIAPRPDAYIACDGRVGPSGVTTLGAGVSTTVLDGGVFYIRLDAFGTFVDGEFVDAPVIDALRTAFETARGYDAAILDLRANPGGDVSIYVELAAWVSAEPIVLYRCRSKVGPGRNDFTERFEFYSTPDGALQFGGRLAVLASARSFSAADFTTPWLGATGAGRARVFGAPTGGGFGSGPATDLGDGWTAAINTFDCINAADEPLEGNPPPVDVPVTFTREDVFAGVDTVVETARIDLLGPWRPRGSAVPGDRGALPDRAGYSGAEPFSGRETATAPGEGRPKSSDSCGNGCIASAGIAGLSGPLASMFHLGPHSAPRSPDPPEPAGGVESDPGETSALSGRRVSRGRTSALLRTASFRLSTRTSLRAARPENRPSRHIEAAAGTPKGSGAPRRGRGTVIGGCERDFVTGGVERERERTNGPGRRPKSSTARRRRFIPVG